MGKRIVAVLAALGLLAAAGCAAGPDGPEAQRLLQEATEAQEQIESLTFTMNMVAEAQGQSFTMKMDGGGYLKGEREGDIVMRGSMAMPDFPGMSFQVVSLDGRFYVNFDGTWQEVPGGASNEQAAQLEAQLAGFDFTKYVKNVKVEKGTVFLGEPVTKIVGTIDTQGLLGGIFGQLGAATQGLGGGLGAFTPPEEALRALGDVRVVLYISDTTHLVKAMRMEFTVDVEGETGTFTVDYALRSVNEPVEIPKPAVVA